MGAVLMLVLAALTVGFLLGAWLGSDAKREALELQDDYNRLEIEGRQQVDYLLGRTPVKPKAR